MKLRISPTPVFLVAISIWMGGCASSPTTASKYPVTHAGAIQKVEEGTVVGVRQVKIDGVSTNLGRLVGAGIGGAVGALAVPVESEAVIEQTSPNSISIYETSNRHENQAAMAVGGAVGMVVGERVEKVLTAKRAQELTIALDSGETVLVVQVYREPGFYEDERVKLYTTRAGDSVVYHASVDPTVDPDTNAYLIPDTDVEEAEFEPVTW
ncbi:hypothetical protein IEN85_21440 [Pelagicoccus sp. NFK12]|uniref:Outer membrane lipoprotein SlyB n=1 Tax=Pelagicoccus enzymogenes TaxID=2773457 RepID=A0A927FBR7_9BACT|nr:hypothetical protein [Pelagicoccus enzymogenes]MBD5782077.1 hypothetical protein [Pelagicoccus enzymogenes]MDQ8196831.1 hypothetical protein [Pelagicoccus enzymogenes]